MKKFITVFALFISISTTAQVYFNAGAGYSVTKSKPAIELNVGYNLKSLLFQGGFITHIDRRNVAVFNARTGAEVVINDGSSIYITGGAAWQLKSTDRKEENMLSYIVGAEYNRFFGEQSAWTISIKHTSGHAFVTAGLKYFFY